MERNNYTKLQSTAIALWTIALQDKVSRDVIAGKEPEAPPLITELVNELGPHHSPGSILLHTHGYDRLFFDRVIDKSITRLQRTVAQELIDQGIYIKKPLGTYPDRREPL